MKATKWLYMVAITLLTTNNVSAGIFDDIIGGFLCRNPETCEEERECLASLGISTPYFYCDCKGASTPFTYGTDMIVSDTIWFTAKLADIKQGLTAYWFSTNSVHFDIFPTCTSDTSILSITIGKNSAYNLSAEDIQAKLDAAGNMGSIAEQMTVNIRVAPTNGAPGRAIFTSYNEGHHSICDYPMPVHYKIPYVISNPDNHYMLTYTAKPKHMAVQWIQNKKEPVRVELTKGNCTTSEVIASTILSDSTKVWIPDMNILNDAYTQKDSLYFHFYTEAIGRVYFISPFQTIEKNIDTTLCKGLGLHLSDTSLYANTTFVDTFYISHTDSILFTTYNLTITKPAVEYDTMTVATTELPFIYKDQAVINKYGTFPISIREEGKCDREIQLYVQAPIATSLINGENKFCVVPTMANIGENIRVEGPMGARIQVYSLLGEQIINTNMQETTTTFSLPVSGHYIVRMSTEKGQVQTRIFIK